MKDAVQQTTVVMMVLSFLCISQLFAFVFFFFNDEILKRFEKHCGSPDNFGLCVFDSE